MEELLKNYPAALSITDVAEILNITPATVRRHVKQQDLPHIKIGRLVRIPKDSLIAYLHGDQVSHRTEETP
ncbi:MAG: helix-turn-helix domain-containing protein [Eubacteriales bacterium]|nr:helix-turn-helix domain-containing protein [Eubacteriales bacterium]